MASSENFEKAGHILENRRHDKDTGSPEVQIAILTARLEQMAKHFEENPKDHHSRIGLFTAVSKRKRLLSYLKNEDVARYRAVLDKFGLRK